MAIEELFFNSNQKIMIIAQARGVLFKAVATREYNVLISEYTPLQVKQSVTGYTDVIKQELMVK